VTKPELGTKRRCNSCTTKFFDLNKDPVICPKCMAVFVPPKSEPVRSRRLADRSPLPAQKVTDPPNEISSLDTTDEEIKPPASAADEGDADVPMLDDQDGELDTSEVIDTQIEKDDT
jgi:uncharacterized protein (TIGR02300 family)